MFRLYTILVGGAVRGAAGGVESFLRVYLVGLYLATSVQKLRVTYHALVTFYHLCLLHFYDGSLQ